MRTSPPPRPRRDAAAFPPLVIPADAPDYARRVLAMVDQTITREACEAMAANADRLAPVPPVSANDVRPPRNEPADEPPMRATRTGDARLLVAGRMHGQADGAAAFFLFHYLRLLSEQAASRAAGRPPPRQTWTTPDWCPAPPPSRAPLAAGVRSTVSALPPSNRRADRPTSPGNIIASRALVAHGSR